MQQPASTLEHIAHADATHHIAEAVADQDRGDFLQTPKITHRAKRFPHQCTAREHAALRCCATLHCTAACSVGEDETVARSERIGTRGGDESFVCSRSARRCRALARSKLSAGCNALRSAGARCSVLSSGACSSIAQSQGHTNAARRASKCVLRSGLQWLVDDALPIGFLGHAAPVSALRFRCRAISR